MGRGRGRIRPGRSAGPGVSPPDRGFAQGFKCPDGPSRSRWHPRDPALLVAPSRPQPGAGSEKAGESRLESLDRVKRADIERAKTSFTRRSPPRGSGTSASVKILSDSEGAGQVISPKFQGNIQPPSPICMLSIKEPRPRHVRWSVLWVPLLPRWSFCFVCWTRYVGCEPPHTPNLKAGGAGGQGTSGSQHQLLVSSPAQSGKGRGRAASGKPEKRVCASVWAGRSQQSLARPGGDWQGRKGEREREEKG